LLAEERARIIEQLTDGIERNARFSKKFDSVRSAMLTLADMHAVESIDILIRHIGYPFTAEQDDLQIAPPRVTYIDERAPAVAALTKIGPACIDPVIEKLTTSDREVERIGLVSVLRQLKVPFTRERLLLMAENADVQGKANLATALKMYDEWLPPAERTKRLLERLKELPLTPTVDK
jgi:hypothetical protein